MTRLEMMQLSQGLSDLYIGLETDLIANIAEYLKLGSIDSSTAQWKIRMLAQLGALDRMNLQTIAEYAGLAPDLLESTLEEAALTAIEELEPGFQKLAKNGIIQNAQVPVEKTMGRSLRTYNKQAQDSLNLVNTVMRYKARAAAQKVINDTAELADKQSFLDMLNKATGKAVTGMESRQAAMRQCIKEMSDKGIPAFVDRAGREWSPEAYINMDIRTTVSNTAHQAQFDRMDDYGMNLVEVSSHAGARPKCAKDQGKIFNRNGGAGVTEDLHGKKIRYYAWKDSSYGEPDGLLGINCGHQVYPFTPGIDVQRYFPYDEKENADLYEKTQVQRELERRVRRSKRECMVLDELGDEEGLRKASVTLKQRQQTLQQYCADNGLSYKPDRTAVVGYNRTIAGKVNAANRRKTLDKSGGSGIIKSGSDVMALENQRYGRNKNTLVDKTYIESGEYRRKFDSLTDVEETNRTLYAKAKEALKHRSGTVYEDMYWIDCDTGKVVACETESILERTVKYSSATKRKVNSYERKKLVALHTHPSSMPPSAADLNACFRHGYKAGYIACHDGKLFAYTADEAINERLYNMYIEANLKDGMSEYDAQIAALNELKRNYQIDFWEVR
ncbi:MAG: phage minor capsid protein [Oscillospiraceae bacterium]|nr:phage minor capsid protein [Oscillospiraceae bacterium]